MGHPGVNSIHLGISNRAVVGEPARFVTFGRRNFHQILKAKFGLNDR